MSTSNNNNNNNPSTNPNAQNNTGVSGGSIIISGGSSGTLSYTNFITSAFPTSTIWFTPPGYLKEEEEEEEKEEHPKAKKIELPDGSLAMDCVRCDTQYQWAEPNQDNGTFKCYGCRALDE